FPADVARDVFGVKFDPIQHEPRRLHHIVSDAVARHPSNSIFRHKMSILSAAARAASTGNLEPRITRMTLIRQTEGNKGNEDPGFSERVFVLFVTFCLSS